MKAGGFPSVFGYSRRASDRCGDGGRVVACQLPESIEAFWRRELRMAVTDASPPSETASLPARERLPLRTRAIPKGSGRLAAESRDAIP